MSKRYAIVLAAGQGTRMKSKLYKVLHPVAGKPMVGHVVDQLEAIKIDEIITIVGHGAETVQDYLGDRVNYAVQKEQLGTAHAVEQARMLLENREGTTIVISGDTPLLTAASLEEAMNYHEEKGAKATVLSAHMENPFGYGRIVRNQTQGLEYIVEEKDATADERQIKEINTGTYIFDNAALFDSLSKVGNNNAQGEYYLPDVIEILREEQRHVIPFPISDASEALGVNDRVALSEAEQLMRKRINEEHMRNGVTLIDPSSTYIHRDVVIGQDSIVEPNVLLKGNTKIGEDVIIKAHSVIENSIIGNRSIIQSSTIEESEIKENVSVGPNSHIRPDSLLEDDVHIGNFVEVKKATLGKGTKAGHLTYIGDATIGENVNFGAGSILVNYDGKHKHHTTIGDNSFIGCNVNVISPVDIGEYGFVGAGSTVSKDVPDYGLSLERAEEKIIIDYVKRLHKRWEDEENESN